MPDPGLDVLTDEECYALLRSASIGRVVYTDAALPVCTPVNFALDGRSVVFRTAAGSRLARATASAVTAFEVDDIRTESRSGWSVLVTGPSSAVTGVGELLRLEQLGLASWAGGDRSHWVRLQPGLVTGRRLAPSPPAGRQGGASVVPAC